MTWPKKKPLKRIGKRSLIGALVEKVLGCQAPATTGGSRAGTCNHTFTVWGFWVQESEIFGV